MFIYSLRPLQVIFPYCNGEIFKFILGQQLANNCTPYKASCTSNKYSNHFIWQIYKEAP